MSSFNKIGLVLSMKKLKEELEKFYFREMEFIISEFIFGDKKEKVLLSNSYAVNIGSFCMFVECDSKYFYDDFVFAYDTVGHHNFEEYYRDSMKNVEDLFNYGLGVNACVYLEDFKNGEMVKKACEEASEAFLFLFSDRPKFYFKRDGDDYFLFLQVRYSKCFREMSTFACDRDFILFDPLIMNMVKKVFDLNWDLYDSNGFGRNGVFRLNGVKRGKKLIPSLLHSKFLFNFPDFIDFIREYICLFSDGCDMKFDLDECIAKRRELYLHDDEKDGAIFSFCRCDSEYFCNGVEMMRFVSENKRYKIFIVSKPSPEVLPSMTNFLTLLRVCDVSFVARSYFYCFLTVIREKFFESDDGVFYFSGNTGRYLHLKYKDGEFFTDRVMKSLLPIVRLFVKGLENISDDEVSKSVKSEVLAPVSRPKRFFNSKLQKK
jgi:hypothetical protein